MLLAFHPPGLPFLLLPLHISLRIPWLRALQENRQGYCLVLSYLLDRILRQFQHLRTSHGKPNGLVYFPRHDQHVPPRCCDGQADREASSGRAERAVTASIQESGERKDVTSPRNLLERVTMSVRQRGTRERPNAGAPPAYHTPTSGEPNRCTRNRLSSSDQPGSV